MDPRTDFTSFPIGVFDSGIGGLSVANAVCGLLPRAALLYVADNARAPYGPRSQAEISTFSEQITRHLLAQGAKLIVVACNTATSLAIDRLRARYPEVPFVGLEPAVKPAATGQRIGVLATEATLGSERYAALKRRYLAGRFVLEDPCKGLVPVIEREAPGSSALRQKLRQILTPLLRQRLDTLVLGCTHYPMVREDIAAICGPGVRLIDPAPAAARQVVRMLERHTPLLPTEPRTCDRAPQTPHRFFCTGSAVPLQRSLMTLPNLHRRGQLVVPGHTLTAGE